MPNPPTPLNKRLAVGLLVAATGVGAGDIVVAAFAGSRYGTSLLWAIVVGAILKYVLNLGLARWDVATGTTFLEGWLTRLPRAVAVFFGGYLLLWSFFVAGALITFNGLVANTLFPLPVTEAYGTAIWGSLQSLLVVLLVRRGGYQRIEQLMSVFIGLMFVLIVACALLVGPDWGEVLCSLVVPRMDADVGTLKFVVALIGGVGGTVTILCYSYWLREKRAVGASSLHEIKQDLGVAYVLTAVFGIAVTIIAAGVDPGNVKGYRLVVGIADELGGILGPLGSWVFYLGFWAAVFTSMIGVWSGVPYLFADFARRYAGRHDRKAATVTPLPKTPAYRWFLLYLALPPIVMALFEKPQWVALAYAVTGAFFAPFLAVLVLYMNNKVAWVGALRNGWATNALLVFCLVVFLGLLGVKVVGG